jgi:hypothetical protein
MKKEKNIIESKWLNIKAKSKVENLIHLVVGI